MAKDLRQLRYQQSLRLLAEYADKLGMNDWEIELVMAGSPIDYFAEVTTANFVLKRFTILINPKQTYKDLKDTIVHELLHVLLWSLSDIIECSVGLYVDEDKKVEIGRLLGDREHDIIEKLIRVIL